MKKIFSAVFSALIATMLLCGCSEADKANHNIAMEAEGYMSISNNNNDELVCTVKIGPDQYKVNYIYLNEYTMYVVEDITGTHTDPYHYKLYFHTDILPSVEVKP